MLHEDGYSLYDGEADDVPNFEPTDENPVVNKEPTILVGEIENENITTEAYGENSIEEQPGFFATNKSQLTEESKTTATIDLEEISLGTKKADGEHISFGWKTQYTDAEINKMKHDVSAADYEVSCRKNDVSNWESKVSLNDTKEHRENGDYAHAVSKLNEAKQRYNDATSGLHSAKVKLNNAT